MLVLTRRPGEKIMIGEDIEVTIVWVRGTQVRLAITAPKDVPVDREEVRRMAKEKENSNDNTLGR